MFGWMRDSILDSMFARWLGLHRQVRHRHCLAGIEVQMVLVWRHGDVLMLSRENIGIS